MKQSNSLQIKEEGYQLAKPVEVLDMAKVLKSHIVHQGLFTNIQGKNYAHVEGWQFAGGLMGLFPRVVAVENLSTDKEIKWKADVEVVDIKSNEVVSRGFAICSKSEAKKKSFDEYAVLSMAQTRAIGKAYRNVIGWVMKAAGYETTPSEEMPATGYEPASSTTTKTAAKAAPAPGGDEIELVCHGVGKSGCGEDLTKQEYDYSKKIYGKPLCREHQKEAKPLKK